MKTPKPGTPFYRIDTQTGEFEIVTFVEENIAEGATVPTWVMRQVTGKPFQRLRISRQNSWRTTKKAALKDYQKILREAVRNDRQMIRDARERIKENQAQIAKTKERLAKV